jgi:hypothetical protein
VEVRAEFAALACRWDADRALIEPRATAALDDLEAIGAGQVGGGAAEFVHPPADDIRDAGDGVGVEETDGGRRQATALCPTS